MTDVFISYSRKDKAFVQQLFQALRDNKRDVWVDWEDIPLASEWLTEIYNGIDAARACIFVISPDSVASQVCGQEVAHAVDAKKRLVPILWRDADQQHMHAAISSHNWLPFKDADSFDTSFQHLLNALDTDLEYVQAHTRLLVRAREWESKHRDPNFLLRGADLHEAEQWLANSTDKRPSPSLLQTQYISASRQTANRTQRALLTAGTVGRGPRTFLAAFSFTAQREGQRRAPAALP